MNDRAPRFARLALVLLSLSALAVALTGCGRSSLESDLVLTIADGGPLPDGAPTCGPATCPGCCENGACVGGGDLTACGGQGLACQDCTQGPPAVCDPTSTPQVCVLVPPPACDCPGGCCDDAGVCRSGQDDANCGAGGGACVDCVSSGQTCSPTLQQCIVQGACGACSGCCVGTECVTGTSTTACGAGGAQCANCAAAGLTCSTGPKGGGSCAQTCGPTNCGGCCGATGCVAGTSTTACGSGGQACAACPAPAEQCVAFGGTAGGGVCLTTACNALNCPGCCDGNGLCQIGVDPTSCGAQGLACRTCAPDQACVNGGCVTPTQCGPSTCVGCCLGNTCVGGGAVNACGSGGQACRTCTANATCVANVCQTNGPCDATSCPSGCCQGNQCQSGNDDSACGSGGSTCAACQPGTQCSAGTCQAGAACGPFNCSGCCDANNNCATGTTGAACGANGGSCTGCGASAQCVNGSCEPTCGPGTCAGCCLNGVCAAGGQDGACGTGGATCVSCAASGESCKGAACVKLPCGPATCKGCCDGTGTCVGGTASTACGAGGVSCASCAASGEQCSAGGVCQTPPPPCGPATCAVGCCDGSGACQDGFLDTQCGSAGASCADCTTQGSTCDVNVSPRVCQGAQTTCPAPYPSCPAGTTTPAPAVQTGVCTGQDLAEAQAACAGGANAAGCQAFLQTLKGNGAAKCEACLQPFVVPFAQGTGLFLCAAPFVSPSCNQATGCYSACETASCSKCTAAEAAQCETTAATGSCASYAQGLTCIQAALAGGGAFCNPAAYTGFGGWLKGVGGHYCQ
jgi:hypothetical protein